MQNKVVVIINVYSYDKQIINEYVKNVLDFVSEINNENILEFYLFSFISHVIHIQNLISVKIENKGKIFTNLLKLNLCYDIINQKTFDYVIFINDNIKFKTKLSCCKKKSMNITADFFTCDFLTFKNVVLNVSKYIYNDLSFDVNVEKWNYQLIKYLKMTNFSIFNDVDHIENYANLTISENLNYITIDLINGLGNLLFQIFSVYQCSLIYNFIPIFEIKKNNCNRPSISKYRLYDKLLKYTTHDNISFTDINENQIEQKTFLLKKNIKLKGLFINYKFIEKALEFSNKILDFSYFDDKIVKYIEKNISKIKHELTWVSVHVRRTDYLKCNLYYNLCETDYYNFALSKFDVKYTYFFIFSDDIKWCKQFNLFNKLPNVFFVENLDDETSLILMSKCNSNIIANSTFSLWGHYLNKNQNKQLIMPKNWIMNDDSYYLNLIPHTTLNVIII